MDSWKEVILDNITSRIGDGLHGTPQYDINGKYHFINGNNLKNGRIEINSKTKTVNREVAEKHKKPLSNKSILISINGTIGNVAYYKGEKCMLGKSACYINLNEDVNTDYMYYVFCNKQFQSYLEMIATGTTIPNVPLKGIRKYTLNLPPLPEQKAIAEVLSSLDDKIDLLHRQNKTLEAMAETLFRQWFVEEADESWETLPLSEIAEVKNGYAFSSKSYIEKSTNTLEVFKMGHIEKGGGLRLNPKRNYSPREAHLEKYILNKNDIVMAMTDMKDNVVILGVPAMIDKDDYYVQNQRVARICLKTFDILLSQYLLYVQLNDKENIAILQSKANSGVQVNLLTQAIKDIEIIIPPLELQLEKGETIIDLFLKKEKNLIQIQSLTTLRDTLLPKLMSGEVRVSSKQFAKV